MPDWDYVYGFGDEGGDTDHDIHDPAGHCGNHLPRSGRSVYGPTLRCRYCGTKDVYWQMTRNGYRLHNTDDLAYHNCRATNDMTSEGFDDVDRLDD